MSEPTHDWATAVVNYNQVANEAALYKFRCGDLEAENKALLTLLQRWYDDIEINRDHSLWDDTEALLEGKQ